VHEICRAAGVGIGTFYHQFPDKSDLMRHLMDEEHQYRVRAFDAVGENTADDLVDVVARVIGGSDPALLRAMIEACGFDERLREFGLALRGNTRERLAAAVGRARMARDLRHPALDAMTAASAALVLGDAVTDSTVTDGARRVITVLAFAEGDGAERIRA
jgi:AcrR family transcriptional regulator